jgi:hypothetical protein
MTKKILEEALRMAIRSIIAQDYAGCYDVCDEKMENCAVRHSTDAQLKVCVRPITKYFLSLAEKKVNGRKHGKV